MKEFILFLALANPVTFKLLKGVFGGALANSYGRPTLLGLLVAAGLFVLLMNYTRVSNFDLGETILNGLNTFGGILESEIADPFMSSVGTPIVNTFDTTREWVDSFGNSCAALQAVTDSELLSTQNGPGPD
jgi:hypothetical protein